MNNPAQPLFLDQSDGSTIAYHFTAGKSSPHRNLAGCMFLGGFMSDMTGTKATALESHCQNQEQPFVRFDYTGHGQSSGQFVDGTIGQWRQDALAVLDQVTDGPQVLVGSSMGGWISLLVALARPDRVAGLVCIAPAPDFTEDMMWPELGADAQAELQTKGICYLPSEYSEEPYAISMRLIEEGRNHLLLRKPIAINCPVRILQGMQDPDVPWQHALKLVDKLTSTDVAISLVKSGDHRLSGPADLQRLMDTVDELSGTANPD